MMTQPSRTIEQAYKTFRNHLRKVETMESLYVIWSYARNVTHNKPFLHDVVPVDGFPDADFIQKIRWVAPWELEVLAREVIVNSELNLRSPKTFRNPNYFSGAVNKLKDIDGAISNQFISVDNVLKEVERRLSHRQFGWQVYSASEPNIARYFKIFAYPKVSNLIEAETGLSTRKIFGIGFVLWSRFMEHFSFPHITFDLPEIQQSDVELFEKVFTADVATLRPILKDEVQVNEKFNYSFHSLRRFPLLRNEGRSGTALFCPVPDLIFRQITGGIYYFVKWTGAAGNALGEAFQSYIGEVINVTSLSPRYEVIPESSFGKEQKDTADWILARQDEALFIECKTKRVTALSKEELLTDNSTDKDLDYIADAVVQVYKTIRDYNEGKYPSLSYSTQRRVYPVVVTMEDWFLMGNTLALVKNKVVTKMEEADLPLGWLDSMPFSICSSHEFELLVRVIKSESIRSVVEGKQKDSEMSAWAYASYFNNKYKHLLSDKHSLFPNIYQEILPISLAGKDLRLNPL